MLDLDALPLEEWEQLDDEIRQRHDVVMRARFDPLGEDDWLRNMREQERLTIAETRLDFKQRSKKWGLAERDMNLKAKDRGSLTA